MKEGIKNNKYKKYYRYYKNKKYYKNEKKKFLKNRLKKNIIFNRPLKWIKINNFLLKKNIYLLNKRKYKTIYFFNKRKYFNNDKEYNRKYYKKWENKELKNLDLFLHNFKNYRVYVARNNIYNKKKNHFFINRGTKSYLFTKIYKYLYKEFKIKSFFRNKFMSARKKSFFNTKYKFKINRIIKKNSKIYKFFKYKPRVYNILKLNSGLNRLSNNKPIINISRLGVKKYIPYKSAFALGKFLSKNLKIHSKKFFSQINILNRLLKKQQVHKTFKGIKIQCNGRVWGKGRTRTLTITQGAPSINSINQLVDFAKFKVVNKFGVKGIKIWITHYNNPYYSKREEIYKKKIRKLTNWKNNFDLIKNKNYKLKNFLYHKLLKKKKIKNFLYNKKFKSKYVLLLKKNFNIINNIKNINICNIINTINIKNNKFLKNLLKKKLYKKYKLPNSIYNFISKYNISLISYFYKYNLYNILKINKNFFLDKKKIMFYQSINIIGE